MWLQSVRCSGPTALSATARRIPGTLTCECVLARQRLAAAGGKRR